MFNLHAVRLASILCAVLLAPTFSPATAADDIREEIVQFSPETTQTAIKARIKGRETVDYRLRAKAGEILTVTLKASNASTYFNILPPGEETALFVGSTSGNRHVGSVPKDGEYTVRVYLMRNAARRIESSRYSIDFKISEPDNLGRPTNLGAVSQRFDELLVFQGIRFRVQCQNEGSLNTLRITPQGLAIDNTEIVREIEGSVTGAEVNDLNADGSPEVYIYVNSAGSGSYGTLVAYSANRRKSLSEIYLPPVTANKKAAEGYQGHDEFAVVESTFVQRFPIYRAGDINAKPTGGMRQLQYKLVPGEASWQLRLERMVEY